MYLNIYISKKCSIEYGIKDCGVAWKSQLNNIYCIMYYKKIHIRVTQYQCAYVIDI